ncbi:MAG: MOSC domain-containing protein [Desulfobacterales bacterium]|nr:MOSC domain-containing protein [Desulfobacterales bacterium]
MSGKIIAVNISDKKGVAKNPIPYGEFKENHGLIGDAHAGNWHRQVSLLGIESVKKLELKNKDGDCIGVFAENLTTEGMILYELAVGTKLKIGDTIQEITQIGKECHDGCAIKKQYGQCVLPKEGIFTKVLKGGIIKPGDEIQLLS